MSTETEAANQVVNMSLKSIEVMAKISGEGAKHLAVYLFAALQGQKRTKGSIRLESLLRSGKELKVFAVKNEDLATFCKEAKRYGVLYCALRDKKNVDGMCDVMVRAEDASKINRIVERFHLATVDTAKIKSEIEKSSGMSEAPAVEQGHEPGHEQVQEQELPKEIAEERNTDDLLDELMGKSELPERLHRRTTIQQRRRNRRKRPIRPRIPSSATRLPQGILIHLLVKSRSECPSVNYCGKYAKRTASKGNGRKTDSRGNKRSRCRLERSG